MKENTKDFLTAFNELSYKYGANRIWDDFILMIACSISNCHDNQRYDEREKMYTKTAEKYTDAELEVFATLAAKMFLEIARDPEQDFLGKMYMELGLGNKYNGQFFTPYAICELMAKMTLPDAAAVAKKKGYISISDPCCGAGALLIAGVHEARRQLEKDGMDYRDCVLIVGQDVDFRAALMCYVQLSLQGVAGVIKVGNTLTEPMTASDFVNGSQNIWFTPQIHSDVWRNKI